MMIDAAVILGADLDQQLVSFFDDEQAREVHVHNADRGCWAAIVERAKLRCGDGTTGYRSRCT